MKFKFEKKNDINYLSIEHYNVLINHYLKHNVWFMLFNAIKISLKNYRRYFK